METAFRDQEAEDYKNVHGAKVPDHITALCGLFFHEIPV